MRSGAVLVMVIALAACGRLGFTPDTGPDGGAEDALAPGVTILTTPFSAPQRVTELAHPALDYDPSLTEDQLEVMFSSRRVTGAPQIFVATRPSTASPWPQPQPAPGLASAFDDRDPASSDGLTLVMSSMRGGQPDLYLATRTSRMSAWSTPTVIAELVTVDEDSGPSLSTDGRTLWFHSGPQDNFDIYTSTRADAASPWSARTPVAELVSAFNDSDPQTAAGGLVLVFSSDRPGGLGIDDIWMATRPSLEEPFGAPFPLSELNSTAVDSSPWLSEDQHTIYFISERTGDREIYMATR